MASIRSTLPPRAGPLVAERGVVTHLFPVEDYGLLRTEDGRELPFRRVDFDGEFDHLNLGTAVRFSEELTERGPEAVDVARED